MSLERCTKEEMFFSIAEDNAKRATCIRRRYGAIFVRNDVVLSMGYCGAPRGAANCCDIGTCIREQQNIPSGQRYELCRSVHAEQNGIINAARNGICIEGSDVYIYGFDPKTKKIIAAEPCLMCKRVLINAGILQAHLMTPDGVKVVAVKDWVNEFINYYYPAK
jgi:dCMP deaminase